MSRLDLDGRIALVTGAARGIGFHTARLLHDRGATVVLVDLRADDLHEAAAKIGERTVAMTGDVTNAESMTELIDEVIARHGGIDVVVANAGIAPPVATTRSIDATAFERVVDVDLLGVFRTVKPALETVVERGGHIVLVASVYAYLNGVLNASYATSKAGVEAFGRALRVELRHTGATVTVAGFGFVDTAMVNDAIAADPRAAAMDRAVPGIIRRAITPETAATKIVAAVERRKFRVLAPWLWKPLSVTRGISNPVMDWVFERHPRIRKVIRDFDADVGRP